MSLSFFHSAASLALLLLGESALPAAISYPTARRDNQIDNFHGVEVSDPYRWLENDSATETQLWVTAENQLTDSILSTYSNRQDIRDRLAQLWNHERYSAPQLVASKYYFEKNNGLQNHSVLYVQDSLGGTARVVLDPNTLSADGSTALSSYSFSKDGRFFAYALSESGSDWSVAYVSRSKYVELKDESDLVVAAKLPDTIRDIRGAGFAWKPDNSGFYYTRFPAKGTVPESDQGNYTKVYWHTLGTSQADDALIYERPENKELGLSPSISEDSAFLIISLWHGTDHQNGIIYRRLDSHGSFKPLFEKFDASYSVVTTLGDTFYVSTNLNAPRRRLVALDINDPAPEKWRDVIPEQKDAIAGISVVNRQFVVQYLHDAYDVVYRYSFDGANLGKIELPTFGSVGGITGNIEDKEMYLTFESYLTPASIYRYDFTRDTLELMHRPSIDFDESQYQTTQVFYPAMDGTLIPMFVTARKGLALDGSAPVWYWGYGGFGISYTPNFRVARLLWLEQGGIYCVANLRGGGEYGEVWHQAGMLGNKQTVFDDYIAGAEWLVSQHYTTRDKLLAYGRSNGGLLTAACVTQRPDVFGAVISQVPLTDMLRYQKFTIGRYWTGEYGNAETNPEHFRFLFAYSPLHNVRAGENYPPTLIVTGESDDRVAPRHSRKFAAALQSAQSGEAPILLRVDRKAGHQAGKPTAKQIDEEADMNTFAFKFLGLAFHPVNSQRR